MSRKKTGLGVCLGAIALTFLFAIPAGPAEEPAVDEDVAEIAAVLLSLRGTVKAAVTPSGVVEETAAAPPVQAGATLTDTTPVCVADVDLDNLVIFEPVFTLRVVLPVEDTIIGIASFYYDPQTTASGEEFDPEAFTAAAHLEIRDRFGGIRFGKSYQPAYGLAEYEGKKLILKFNDVGPLRPGRKFDLSRAAMAYFDGLDKGLLSDFKVTPLPVGQIYPAGPVTDAQLAVLGIDVPKPVLEATGPAAVVHSPDGTEAKTAGAPLAPPVGDFVPALGDVATLADMQDG